jgi:aminopeptidase N
VAVPRLRALTRSLIAAVVVGSVATGSVAAPSAAPQVPDPYYPQDGNPGYDVLHYDIRDRYRFGDRFLAGTTTVTLRPSAELAEVRLDLLLTVDGVWVDGVPADHRKPNKHELVIDPDAPLAAGESVEVRVRYHGRPSRIRWRGERNWLANDHEVVTMNEPHMAAWWFPSNDHPSDKARFDVRITTGRSKVVVGNGVLKSRKVHGRKATTHWRMRDPMTTYLAFFAAGDFAIDRGRARGLRYYNAVSKRLGRREVAGSRRALGRSAAITRWLERELGDYPFATTGGLVTSLAVGFALENQTRPTYPGWPSRLLLVHELAHQWFGDAVSVARWRDIWLNEGFASYMEHRYDETHGGPTTDRWLHREYRFSRNDTGFWRVDLADPGPTRQFAWPIYQRGAMALAALRNRIGANDFRLLLRQWVADHDGGNAQVEQFEALAESVSGEQLDRFFDAWLRDDVPPPRRPRFGL